MKGPACEIEKSLVTRLAQGAVNSTVPSASKKEEVWTLKQSGQSPKLQVSEVPKDQQLPSKVSRGPPCQMEVSLKSRISAGAITSTVASS